MDKVRRWRGPLTVIFRLTIISGLLYVATGLLYSRLPAPPATASDRPPQPTRTSSPTASPATAPAAPAPPPELRTLLERNIFQRTDAPPAQRPAAGDDTLILLGTVVGQDARAVLRTGQQQGLYREGDSVAGARIERIERHRVTIRRQGRAMTLLVEERRTDATAAGTAREMIVLPEEGEAGTVEVQPRPLTLPRPPEGAVPSRQIPRSAVKTDPVPAAARETANGGASLIQSR